MALSQPTVLALVSPKTLHPKNPRTPVAQRIVRRRLVDHEKWQTGKAIFHCVLVENFQAAYYGLKIVIHPRLIEHMSNQQQEMMENSETQGS